MLACCRLYSCTLDQPLCLCFCRCLCCSRARLLFVLFLRLPPRLILLIQESLFSFSTVFPFLRLLVWVFCPSHSFRFAFSRPVPVCDFFFLCPFSFPVPFVAPRPPIESPIPITSRHDESVRNLHYPIRLSSVGKSRLACQRSLSGCLSLGF